MIKWWQQMIKVAGPLFSNHWLLTQQNSILSAAAVITLANGLVSVSGFMRDRFLLAIFAGNQISLQAYDAFRVAFQIPDLIFQLLIVGALSASFIPLFSLLKKTNRTKAFHFTNICLNYLLLFFLLACVLIFIFAPELTAWRIGDAYNRTQIEIVITLTRIMMVGQFFFAISSFFSGMLQSYQRFIVPAIVPLFYNAGIVTGTYLFHSSLGIYAAGLGVILGAFLHMIIQLPFVYHLGWRYQFSLQWQMIEVKKLFSLMPARTLTLGINEIQNFGLSYFVTSVNGIGYTILILARSLIIMPVRFIGVPIAQAALPFLADLSQPSNISLFKKTLLQSLNQIVYLACPAAVLLLILRLPVVRLVFGTRNFPWELTIEVAKMVAIMALSIPAQAIFHLLVRSFHALSDTVTPFLISLFTSCVFFIGAALAIRQDSHQLTGIAITIAACGILEACLYLLLLSFKVKKLLTFSFILEQIKIYAIAAIMAVSLYIPYKSLDTLVFNTTKVIPLLALTGITSIIGLSVYILLSKIFHIAEMQILVNIAKKFQRKKEKPKLLMPPTEIISGEMS